MADMLTSSQEWCAHPVTEHASGGFWTHERRTARGTNRLAVCALTPFQEIHDRCGQLSGERRGAKFLSDKEIFVSIVHRYALLSLISVLVTAALITVNHLYSLGPSALGLGAVLVVLPVAFLWWFKATGSRVPLAGYLLVSLWIVVGFGLQNGLWEISLNLFLGSYLASVSTSFPKPTIGDFWFEASGILTFVGSLFVLYFGAKLLQAKLALDRGVEPKAATTAQTAWVTAGSVLATVAIVGAYAYATPDRFVAPSNGIVRIAVIVPTAGPYAVLGGSFMRAVEVAKDDLKNTKYRYELVPVDTGTDPPEAKACASNCSS
jgi:hypothetical protein